MPTSCIFIHISTDFVFDGQKEGAYTETDETQPLGVYGKSKEKGEQALLSSPKSTYIFRTAWLYSPYGHNFLKTMQKLGSNRPSQMSLMINWLFNIEYHQGGNHTIDSKG